MHIICQNLTINKLKKMITFVKTNMSVKNIMLYLQQYMQACKKQVTRGISRDRSLKNHAIV